MPDKTADSPDNSRLRSLATWARPFGAAFTAGLVIYAGRHNPSVLLVTLFFLWVLLPYFGLIAADRLAQRTPPGIASAIHAAALLLALVPPIIYATVSMVAPGHPTTFAFLVVPAASWLAIATLLLAARFQRKK